MIFKIYFLCFALFWCSSIASPSSVSNKSSASGASRTERTTVITIPKGYANSTRYVRRSKGTDLKIVRSSHFSQTYKLGYKILLVCEAEGEPRPIIQWLKGGKEIQRHNNIHIDPDIRTGVENTSRRIKSKIEIDPATVGDQAIYSCMVTQPYSKSNPPGLVIKNFKTEYFY